MIKRLMGIALLCLGAGTACGQGTPVAPAPDTSLKVIVFDGGWNLPIWAAQRQGFFKQNKLAVELIYTPNSVQLVTGLLNGTYDLALAGIDNVIAYQEGQGEVPVQSPDLFAFLGGDNGLLSVVSAPAIKSAADLKGKSLSVDAMTTGFAFVLRDYVARNGLADTDVSYTRAGSTANRYKGLVEGKTDATLLRTPFDLLAREKGFNVLAEGKALGDFQGTVGVATRRWAEKNEDALVRFIRAYRSGLDWIHVDANRPIAEALLVANTSDMTPELAKAALPQLIGGGLTRNAAINLPGIANVLALRSRFGTPAKTLGDPGKYVDSRYLEKAAVRP